MSTSQDTASFRGRDYVFLDAQVSGILEQLTCPICLRLPTEPVSTSCGHAHLFCRECIKDFTSCPLCRRRRHEGFSISPDVKIEQIMKKLRVQCEDCGWQGQLGDATIEHVCGSEYEQPSSPHKPFTCQHCGHCGFFNEASIHLAICKSFPRPCPEMCGHIVTEKSIDHHLTMECTEVHVACVYAMFGCDAVVRRREMSDHLASPYHSALKTSEALSTVGKFYLSPSDTMPDLGCLPLLYRPWLQNKISPLRYLYLPRIIKMTGIDDIHRHLIILDEKRYSISGGFRFLLNWTKCAKVTGMGIVLLIETDSDGLNFPFNANIKVSLLNQERDSNHMHWNNICLKDTNHFYHGERQNQMVASKYFYHVKKLDYNSETDTAYLKNGTVFLRIDRLKPVVYRSA